MELIQYEDNSSNAVHREDVDEKKEEEANDVITNKKKINRSSGFLLNSGKKSQSPSLFELELHNEELQDIAAGKWCRKLLEENMEFNDTNGGDNLVFQQIEIDTYMDAEHHNQISHNSPLSSNSSQLVSVPVMRLFGVTKDEHSVLCHVHGFLPYFYIPAPWSPFNAVDKMHFSKVLESKLLKEERSSFSKGPYILSVEIVSKQSIYGFSDEIEGRQNAPFLCITVANPSFIATCRRILEGGIEFNNRTLTFNTFESNIPFVMRFMVDARITGMNWIEIPCGKFSIRPSSLKTSRCQLEIDAHWTNLISHAPDDEWSSIAPLRILSFDIECAGRKGIFPDASVDPVIQIANIVTKQGESKPFVRNVFTLGSCNHIVGADVRSFQYEEDLLTAWSNFVVECDPDVIIGYNITNFDLPYLLERAETLKLHKFPYLGRIINLSSRTKDTIFSSKAYGTRESKTINTEGRIIFDMLQLFQREYKLRSYSLNSVSAEFLGEQKEDVHHSIIADLQNGSADTRRRLAIYCLKDAVLPQRLMDKLMCLINYIEMARVTGVPFNFLLARGQQIKVVSQLYRKAADNGFVIPALKVEVSDEQYEGATVIEPIRGYYNIPIATLDFASLYPSIMMAHNLCYTTLISSAQASIMNPDDYERTPSGDCFIRAHIRKGILPCILEDLLAARKRAKADLKKEIDPSKKAVLDGRQLALKISANSVYGFTGATIGKLPCIPISQSVTAYGRVMIEETQRLVETKYTVENGYLFDSKVIYGDTDSVMVNFGVEDLVETMRLGKEAAQFITGHFIRPINLDFEKVYFPFLLINKKRYAGLYWTNSTSYDKLDTKGIETVRRDNCRLVQTVIDTCLKKILIERDVEGAKSYAKQIISDLLQNKVDLNQLVITKALSRSGEDYTAKQAHVELAERMKKRDPGSAPSLGDRVAYVIIKSTKGAAAYQKSEDPIYVLENNLAIDTKYYLDNQLSKPLLRIFEPIIANPEELLSGEHTRIVHVSTPTAFGGAMKNFIQRSNNCLGCKAPIKGDQPVCQYCKGDIFEIYQKNLQVHNQLQVSFSRLWSQCQRCQQDLHHDVLCTSRDCPIFYMRKKIQKDLKESTEVMERFKQVWS